MGIGFGGFSYSATITLGDIDQILSALPAGTNNIGDVDARVRNFANTAYLAPKVNENPVVMASANIDTGTTGVKVTVSGVAGKDRIIRDVNVVQISGTPKISVRYSQDSGTTKRAINITTMTVEGEIAFQSYIVLEDASDQLTIEVDTLSAGNADVTIFGHEEDTTN